MELIQPSAEYFESYRAGLIEFAEHRVTGFWTHYGPADDAAAYLELIERYSHKSGIPQGLVPVVTYWLVDEGEFIGNLSIRPELNAALERRGGHIGYAIRPSKQRRGYGSQILALALPKVRTLGIREALVTCNTDNIASRKIIEKNGGRLADEVVVDGTPVLRFWISL